MKILNSFAWYVLPCLTAVGLAGCNDVPPGPGLKFEVEGASICFAAEEPASQEITVTAENIEWSVAVNAEAAPWLSTVKGTGTVTVTAGTNTSAESRSGTVTVTPEGGDFEPVAIAVTQLGADAAFSFSVDDTPLTFAATPEGGQDIAVAAENVAWSVAVNAEAAGWLSAEPDGGIVTVTAAVNEATANRSGTVTVTPDNAGFEPVAIAVTQNGKTVVPEVPAEADFGMVYSAEYYADDFGKGAGGGRFAITLMNVASTRDAIFESFTLEGFMPLADDPSAGFVPLAPGSYVYELGEEYTARPYTFLSYYGAVRNAGTFYMSTLFGLDNQLFYPVYGGTVTVTDEGFDNYKIVADVVDGEGRAMKATYTGALILDNTTVAKEAAYDVTFTTCQSALDLGQYFEQPIREFELQFAKNSVVGADNISERLVLRFNADLDDSADGQIPAGRYFPFTTEKYAPRAAYTYMRGGSAYGITAGSYYVRQSELYGERKDVFFDQDGGYIDVNRGNDGTYTIAVRVIGTEYNAKTLNVIQNVVVNCDFSGVIDIK